MDKKHVFEMIKEQNTTVLVELLDKAYEEMTLIKDVQYLVHSQKTCLQQ